MNLKNIFKRQEYVFLLHQTKLLLDDNEKALRREIDQYILKSISGRLFDKRRIMFVEPFTNTNSYDTFTLYCTFEPQQNKYPKFSALIYEIYAFSKVGDDRMISFDYTKKNFENEFGTITTYKFKI